MITKQQQKMIRSLGVKKFRDELSLFVAEGEKLVSDLLPFFECRYLFITPECDVQFADSQPITATEIKQISQLTTPTSVLAVFAKPANNLPIADLQHQLILVLDGVQNPGNLGTILRISDWFGIRHVVCSHDTADAFSPKTVQATMGALARVQTHYVDLTKFLADYAELGLPIYGTSLHGENIYRQSLASAGAIVMGNEGKGVSPEVERLVTNRLLIPNFPEGEPTSESLNVAVATAIVCAEFRRPK